MLIYLQIRLLIIFAALHDANQIINQSKNGVFKKNNKFSVPTYTTSNGENFVDALSSSLSTIPRSKEEHEELDDLNNKFSERLDKLEIKKAVSNEDEERTTSKGKDKFSENKKRIV
ncbi:unnamed protein product [Rhizophagus irregularis]|nr:unnamed protein product [Rhizophagus irregularis]